VNDAGFWGFAGYALAWASFGLGHSLLARESVKARLRPWFGRGLRLAYNVVAGAHLVLVLAIGQWLLGAAPAYAPAPLLDALRLLAVAAGGAVLLAGARRYDLGRLGGLTQLSERRTGADLDDEPFAVAGIQRYVRHPLYLGTLLVIWGVAASPLGFATAAFATIYVRVGIRYEERDLVRRFGERYEAYRREVGMLFPRLRRHRPLA
jgi:protein-S-isoprenylcysteine O-methyltransferase Ste14